MTEEEYKEAYSEGFAAALRSVAMSILVSSELHPVDVCETLAVPSHVDIMSNLAWLRRRSNRMEAKKAINKILRDLK